MWREIHLDYWIQYKVVKSENLACFNQKPENESKLDIFCSLYARLSFYLLVLYIGPLSEHGQPFVRAVLACRRRGGLYDQHGGQVHDLHT